MNQNDIAAGLRIRFESDRILGARALPVRLPTPRPAIKADRSGKNPPIRSADAPRDERRSPPPPSLAPTEIEKRRVALQVIDDGEVKPCVKCALHSTRTKTVFGVGSPAARIVFVGEAPGADEDTSGIPFVGRAGQLLTAMIEKGMGLKRDDVYICNVLKCRPPNNRTPAPDEIASCRGYLWRQLEIIQPQVVVALGAPAAQTLLNTRDGIGRLRGQFHPFHLSGSSLIGEPIPLMPTFHPAYLLRDPSQKRLAWEDLKQVLHYLDLPVPCAAG